MSQNGATRGLFNAPIAHADYEGGEVTVNINRPSTYCISAHDTVWLQRSQATGGPVRLRHGQRRQQINWEEGATRAPWPSDIAIEDGDRFELTDDAGGASVAVVFRRLPQAPTAAAWVAAGSLAGCKDQVASALHDIAAAIEAGPTH